MKNLIILSLSLFLIAIFLYDQLTPREDRNDPLRLQPYKKISELKVGESAYATLQLVSGDAWLCAYADVTSDSKMGHKVTREPAGWVVEAKSKEDFDARQRSSELVYCSDLERVRVRLK